MISSSGTGSEVPVGFSLWKNFLRFDCFTIPSSVLWIGYIDTEERQSDRLPFSRKSQWGKGLLVSRPITAHRHAAFTPIGSRHMKKKRLNFIRFKIDSRLTKIDLSPCLLNLFSWIPPSFPPSLGVSSNQSSLSHEYPDCREGGSEASLLVSPLVVAGIVIGLVLFLSCVTIIVGSLRKDGRLRNPHLRASYGEPPDATPVSAVTPTHCRLSCRLTAFWHKLIIMGALST